MNLLPSGSHDFSCYVTRLDLAYSVHIFLQFIQEPRSEHWEAVLRVVRCLKGTSGQVILLRGDKDLTLEGLCDSVLVVCSISRRFLTCWLIFLGQSPILGSQISNIQCLVLPRRLSVVPW